VPSDLLLAVVRLTNVLTYLLTCLLCKRLSEAIQFYDPACLARVSSQLRFRYRQSINKHYLYSRLSD